LPNGTYRVLVSADSTDEPWPSELRLGSGARGWALLREVRVWFEVWRLVNGFPPALPKDAKP
jgi:membrane fusion protein, adhesin transport system